MFSTSSREQSAWPEHTGTVEVQSSAYLDNLTWSFIGFKSSTNKAKGKGPLAVPGIPLLIRLKVVVSVEKNSLLAFPKKIYKPVENGWCQGQLGDFIKKIAVFY